MKNHRRKLSSKFKSKVTLDALKERESMSELASRHHLHPNQITTWKKTVIEGVESLFSRRQQSKEQREQQDEHQRLLCKIGELQMENDYLKKNLGLK